MFTLCFVMRGVLIPILYVTFVKFVFRKRRGAGRDKAPGFSPSQRHVTSLFPVPKVQRLELSLKSLRIGFMLFV